LSPNGLSNVSVPLLPPPLGGGFGGAVVIMTREMDLSNINSETIGFIYGFLDKIGLSIVFRYKELF